MQFAAVRGLCGVQGFKKLHVGGHDNGLVPVLGGKLGGRALAGLTPAPEIGSAVMSENVALSEYILKNADRLTYDADIGDNIYDPLHAVCAQMVERKRH